MSTKSIAQKLQIKPESFFWISHEEHVATIQPLPENVTMTDQLDEANVALLFAESAASLTSQLSQHGLSVTRPAIIWIAYPKGNKADINRDTLWPIAGEHGLRPNGQVAIDDYWSALRFRPLKEGEEQFTGGKK